MTDPTQPPTTTATATDALHAPDAPNAPDAPSARDDGGDAAGNVRPRFELLWAALLVAALAVAHLWNPIVHFSDSTYTPVDFMQELTLTRVQDGWFPGNQLISDVAVEYHPWYLFDRELVHEGKWPLWNRYNGFGVPHLGNFQAAVFSPLTFCYYLFSFKVAVLLTALIKLFCLGWFTYLFLRALRLSPVACLFGAAVYTFAGHNMLRLGYSQSSVAMMVPAGLWALERIAQGWARRRRTAATGREKAGATPALRQPGGERPSLLRVEQPGRIAVFVAVLVVGLLLGHPETFYFALMTMIVYAAARGFALWSDHRRVPGAMRALRALGLQLTLAGILAALISAVQLVPFFEYLGESFIFGDRVHGNQTPLPIASWPCLVFPNLLGNPSEAYFVDYTLPLPDFDTVTMAYVGSLALLLWIAAPFFARGRRVLTFFFVMGCVWFVYAYGLFGTQPLFELVPTLEMVPINRSQPFFHICVAVCGAFFVDRLVERRAGTVPFAGEGRDALRTVALIAAGLFFLALFRAGAADLAAETWRLREGNMNRDLIAGQSALHMKHIGWLLAAGVALAALGWIARSRDVRLLCAGGLVPVAYAQTGHLFSDYNPITPDRMVYPETPLIEDLRREVGNERHVFLGPTALPPHVNSVYRIVALPVWDGINIRRFELLRRRLFSQGGNWQETRWTTTRGLQLFGIGKVIDEDGWIDVDTAFGFVEEKPDEYKATEPLVPGNEVELDFSGFDDRFSALRLCFATGARPQVQTIDVAVTDKHSGEMIHSHVFGPGELDPRGLDRVYVRLAFPPPAGARDRTFTLRVSSPDGRPEDAWSLYRRNDYGWMANRALWRNDGFREPPAGKWHERVLVWQTRQAGRILDGQLVVDMHLGLHHFRTAGRVGPYAVYDFKAALPRYRTVTRAWVARDETEAGNAMLRLGLDPEQVVVLEDVDPELAGPLPAADGTARDVNEPVEILREDNGHLVLRTTRREPGWLVLAQPWYPGWKARVNGVEVPIVRANYAFQAVRLEPGPSRIEVDYEPLSVLASAWISLASLLACAAWLWRSSRIVARS